MAERYENENGLIVTDRSPPPGEEVIASVLKQLGEPPCREDLSLVAKFNGCTLKYRIPMVINGKQDAVSFNRFFSWIEDEDQRSGIIYQIRMRSNELIGMLPIAQDDGGSVVALNISNTRFPARAIIGLIREVFVEGPAGGGHYRNESIVMKLADSFHEYLGKLEYRVDSTTRLIDFLKSRGKDTQHLQEEIERFSGTGWGR